VKSVSLVTLMYCGRGETVGWIKMPLGTQVAAVLMGLNADPVTLREKDTAAMHYVVLYGRKQACVCINHGPCLLCSNDRMDHYATVRWDPAPSREREIAAATLWPMSFAAKRSFVSATADLLYKNL